MAKDYYQTLGVARNATDSEIKKAFRRLAKQYHPDVSKGAKGAEDRFKEINEAYAVLSDPPKRRQYDRLGQAFGGGGPGGFRWGESAPGGSEWAPGADASFGETVEGLGDVFAELFGMGGMRGRGRRGRAGESPFGPKAAPPVRGQDLRGAVDIDFLEAIHGTTCDVSLAHSGHTEKISVKIPAGIIPGQQMRLSGKGAASPGGGPHGDLFLEVRVRPHPLFWREGADVYTELPITFYEAILGGTIAVPTPAGAAKMKLPPGVASGQKFRLKGKGAPVMGKKEQGDLYAIIQIVPPKEISAATRQLAEEWASQHPYQPRNT